MSAREGSNLRQYVLYSESVAVPVGSEPAQFIGVNASGVPAANAYGITNVSRDGSVSVVLLGVMPAKVKNGATFAKGAAVTTDANGELIPATTATSVLGIALEAITVASNEYIEVFVNTSPVVAVAP